ncbi:MAG: DUF177 domain-containing protein [Sphingomonadaceae bacterium]|uniref:YceD family protein n=1 Tax=Thermaurantiacus sp. TaxID=2820283 RepID=UPI00298ED942|nr:DUF177 domain-containing protein [Thermaurantiacus sp.]MCS6985982.1 DUF177 domain-containing protein [Sphingomonadaceae bacterium]MDW8414802.1 DUF177 domain-containing protein [Thermaurantiacus sp.]
MEGFEHRVALDHIPAAGLDLRLEADADVRAAIARRFDWLALDRLVAEVRVQRIAGGARVMGRVTAQAALACVASGEPVAAVVDERFDLRFLPSGPALDEVELSADDLDVLPLDADGVAVGEAVVQTVALALPAYPRAAGVVVPGLLSEEEANRLRHPLAAFQPRS